MGYQLVEDHTTGPDVHWLAVTDFQENFWSDIFSRSAEVVHVVKPGYHLRETEVSDHYPLDLFLLVQLKNDILWLQISVQYPTSMQVGDSTQYFLHDEGNFFLC